MLALMLSEAKRKQFVMMIHEKKKGGVGGVKGRSSPCDCYANWVNGRLKKPEMSGR